MTTNSTPWSMRTRQIASAWSSSSSGDIAHKAVALRTQPLTRGVVEGAFPLGEDRVMAVLLGQFQPEVEARVGEHLDERGNGRLTSSRLVRRQRRLGDPEEI